MKTARQRKEPLITTPLPDWPWKTIGTDLFELEKKHYLLVVDYFSRFPEVILLKSTTSTVVITALKSIFSGYGIPEEVRSDNGPQYSSMEFAKFASTHGFNHITSSPLYPQSNGQAERTVQTVKQLIKKSNDPYLALMSYRATPLTWCNFSPSELLMGRKIRTTIPQTGRQLTPQWSYLGVFRRLNNLYKQRQKRDFDRNHGVKELPDLVDDKDVWITSQSDSDPTRGRVVTAAETPRSYVVEIPTGEVRRNRSQLRVIPENNPTSTTASEGSQPPESPLQKDKTAAETPVVPPKIIMTRSKTETKTSPPDRLKA